MAKKTYFRISTMVSMPDVGDEGLTAAERHLWTGLSMPRDEDVNSAKAEYHDLSRLGEGIFTCTGLVVESRAGRLSLWQVVDVIPTVEPVG